MLRLPLILAKRWFQPRLVFSHAQLFSVYGTLTIRRTVHIGYSARSSWRPALLLPAIQSSRRPRHRRSASVETTASAQQSTNKKRCWKCNAELDVSSMHCDRAECGAIQNAPSELTYFEVLLGPGSRPTFNMDTGRLKQAFLRLQQRVHPDSYAKEGGVEYAHAQALSSLVNKAYATLRDPLSRANYMLSLNGVIISEREPLENKELIVEVLEIRERLQEANDETAVNKITAENEGRIVQVIADIGRAFEEGKLMRVKDLAIKLRYWYSVRDAIANWETGRALT